GHADNQAGSISDVAEVGVHWQSRVALIWRLVIKEAAGRRPLRRHWAVRAEICGWNPSFPFVQMLLKQIDNPLGSMAITEWIPCVAHPMVLRWVTEKRGCLGYDSHGVGSYEFTSAHFDQLGTLGTLAEHKDRLAQRWRFLLYP